MKSYFVSWECDIDADSPREAAQKAFDMIRTDGTHATIFDVIECDPKDLSTHGDKVRVDLLEDEDDGN